VTFGITFPRKKQLHRVENVARIEVSVLLDDYKEPSRELTAGQSDEELISRSFDDPRAFEKLVERYEEAFLRKAISILGKRETAEDAVQDAFVKMYRNAKRFTPQPGAGFKSWGYRILVNTCFTEYSKRKREGVFLADIDPEIQELIADKKAGDFIEQEMDRNEVSSLLSRLSEGLSEPMRLHFIEGKPHAEVAKIMGISEGAVRARVHRAKKELQELKREFDKKTNYVHD